MCDDDSGTENAAIELHDSEISLMQADPAGLTIHFGPAYVHRRKGIAENEGATGWTQDALMRLSASTISGCLPNRQVTLAGGEVTLGDRSYDNLIPVPISFTGKTTVNLEFDDGSTADIDAEGCSLTLVGEGSYVEEIPDDVSSQPIAKMLPGTD